MMNRVPQIKAITIWMAAGLMVLVLPGCSYLNDNNKKDEKPPVLKLGAETACLKDTKKIILDYFDGHATVAQMDAMFDCVLKGVDTFTSKIRGQDSNSYSLDELRRFAIDYFDKDDQFATQFLEIAFEIKSTTVGGREANISRNEIEKVKGLLVELKSGIRKIDPYADIIFSRLPKGSIVEASHLEAAIKALHETIANIGSHFESKDGVSIPIDRIFEVFSTLKGIESGVAKYVPLVKSLKSILIEGPSDRIKCEEWSTSLRALSRMYALYLRYTYGLSDRTIGEDDTIDVVKALRKEARTLLNEAYVRHDSKIIPLSKIRDLIQSYHSVFGDLPKGIKPESLEPILPKIFTQILRPSRIKAFNVSSSREDGREVGFGAIELEALDYYTANWIIGLEHAQKMFVDGHSRSGSQLRVIIRDEYGKFNEGTAQGRKLLAGSHGRTQKDIWAHYDEIVRQGARPLRAMTIGEDLNGNIIDAPLVEAVRKEADYTFKDILSLNTTRWIVELVLRSFTSDIERARMLRGLTSDEAETLYKDMRQVGFDLEVSDPRSQRAGHRSFMEANLFTSVGDGNDYISFREAVEWFNFVSASGGHAIDVLEKARVSWLKSHNVTSNDIADLGKDIFNKQKVEIEAYRSFFKANFGVLFANLPGMARYVRQLIANNRYTEFEVALENAARPVGHTRAPMDSTSIRTIVPILYYTESIFTRYDKNQNDILENSEAWEIFPIMKNTIRDISNGVAKDEVVQKMVFAKLLISGEPPPDDWKKYISTPAAWLKERWFKPSIDRLGVIKLIAAIASTSRNNAIKAIKTLYEAQKTTIESEFNQGSVVILDQLHDFSRCSPISLHKFREVMRLRTTKVFTPINGEYTADTFVRQLQEVIQFHPELQEQCQPLLRL